jgi:hypothetical protein
MDSWSTSLGSCPDLLVVVPKRCRASRIVAFATQSLAWISDIVGPCTIPVMLQYLELHQHINNVSLYPDILDNFIWHWCSLGCYSASSVYNTFFLGQTSLLGAKEMWKTKAPNKCRFFIWLVLHGRCCTSDHLQHHGLDNNAPALFAPSARRPLITCLWVAFIAGRFGSSCFAVVAGSFSLQSLLISMLSGGFILRRW